jgi:hypothetical protein
LLLQSEREDVENSDRFGQRCQEQNTRAVGPNIDIPSAKHDASLRVTEGILETEREQMGY